MKKRLEVRQVAVAFLTSGPSSPADAQLQFIHSPGFPLRGVQFWRLNVAEPGTAGREHLLYFPPHPAPSEEVLKEVASAFRRDYPAAALCRSLRDAEGEAEIVAEGDPAEAAAAIAEVKRAGSWDESPLFRIVSNGEKFGVTLRWRDELAEATVMNEAG